MGYRCVQCGFRIKKLYVQYSPGNIRLTKCENCKAVADEYIECELMILLIDLILHKPKAYRHLLYNVLNQETGECKVRPPAFTSSGFLRFVQSILFPLTSVWKSFDGLGRACCGNQPWVFLLWMLVSFYLEDFNHLTRLLLIMCLVSLSMSYAYKEQSALANSRQVSIAENGSRRMGFINELQFCHLDVCKDIGGCLSWELFALLSPSAHHKNLFHNTSWILQAQGLYFCNPCFKLLQAFTISHDDLGISIISDFHH